MEEVEIKEVPAEGFGLIFQQRFKEGKSLLGLGREERMREVQVLREALEKRGAEFNHMGEKLKTSTYKRNEQMRRIVLETLNWDEDDFYDLVDRVIVLPGGGIKKKDDDLVAIREKLKRRAMPFKTANWEDFSSQEKKYVFRALGVLKTVYDILHLCSLTSRNELFLEAAELFVSKVRLRMIRGRHKAKGEAGILSDAGIDYNQVRPIPPDSLDVMIKSLLKKGCEISTGEDTLAFDSSAEA